MSAHGDVDLGHTAAGWTGMAIASIGFAIMGLAVITVSVAVAVCGALVVVLALLVTWALHLSGWGKPSGPPAPSEWSWRVRDLTAREGHPDCLGCRMAGRGRASAPVPAIVRATVPATPSSVQPSRELSVR